MANILNSPNEPFTPPTPVGSGANSNPYWSGEPRSEGWKPGGEVAWGNASGVDPNTGQLTGPGGLVPHGYGLQFQALHEQAIFRMQQRFMQQGMDYTRGALGLLQSYRPGGGAAIESGVYRQLGEQSFQRAAQTQPMDLLGDYRRHEQATARSKANRAREIGTAVQIAGIAASVAFPAAAPLIMGATNAYAQGQNQKASAAESQQPMQGGPPQQGQQPQGASPVQWSSGQPQGAPAQGAGGGKMGAPAGGGYQSQLAPQGGGGAPQQQSPGQMPSQGGQPQGGAPGQPGGQGGQEGAGGMGQMGPQPVGLNGDFSPAAYSMRGAQALMHPIQQMVLQGVIADDLEQDPTWRGFTAAIDARLAQRYVA